MYVGLALIQPYIIDVRIIGEVKTFVNSMVIKGDIVIIVVVEMVWLHEAEVLYVREEKRMR